MTKVTFYIWEDDLKEAKQLANILKKNNEIKGISNYFNKAVEFYNFYKKTGIIENIEKYKKKGIDCGVIDKA